MMGEAGRKTARLKIMNDIVIRNLDDETLQKLKQLAWQDGRRPEDMAKHLFIETVRSRSARRPFLELVPQD